MDSDILIAMIEERLERISIQIQRIRNGVERGVYDPREIAGDVTLVIEGELRQTKKLLEENKTSHQ